VSCLNVVEAPAGFARRLIAALRRSGRCAPLAVCGDQWLVFVQPAPDPALIVERAGALGSRGVIVHSAGSWVSPNAA